MHFHTIRRRLLIRQRQSSVGLSIRHRNADSKETTDLYPDRTCNDRHTLPIAPPYRPDRLVLTVGSLTYLWERPVTPLKGPYFNRLPSSVIKKVVVQEIPASAKVNFKGN